MLNGKDSETKQTVTFIADSPIDGGWQERPTMPPPSEPKFFAAVLLAGAAMGAGLWVWLAVRLAFFSAVE